MNAARHDLVCEVFLKARELALADREAFLRQACAEDNQLRNEVESLLAAEAKRTADVLPREMAPTVSLDGNSPLSVRRIGQYELQRVIATGGMGAVYEARQANPRRVVAVKVIKHGVASRAALRRFEYEGQILGRLRHSGIAQIFEAGIHTDEEGSFGPAGSGVPFFAMEYIPNGKPLVVYAQENRLSTRERMKLFVQACDAVHHGHQKGIIHRDLKPSNILVDGGGQLKLIDFGVARSSDAEVVLTTMRTEVGQLIGTLQYMSPEQCAADPHDIDIRSDVYSLGVVLYELLCDRMPYDLSKVPIHEAPRLIRDSTPAPLSMLNRTLRGDLETIVTKALEKDRTRRYQSSLELAQDIRRYLDNEPILARPPSVIYQIRVFARRNKAAFAAVAGVFIVLLTGIIVSTTLYARAEYERELAERARDEAEAVTGFLSSMLATRTLWKSDRNLQVRQMLDEASKSLTAKFEDQPLVEARLRSTMGNTYKTLDMLSEAEFHLPVAVEIYQRVLGEGHIETIRSMIALANLRIAQRRINEAKSVAERAYAQASKLLGEKHPETLQAQFHVAWAANTAREYQTALSIHERVLDARRRILGEEHPDTVQSMFQVAGVHWNMGNRQKAAPVFENVLEMQLRILGEAHPDTSYTMSILGNHYRLSGRLAEAADLHERVVAICRQGLGNDNSRTLDAMSNLAISYRHLGRTPESIALLVEAMEGSRRSLGEEDKRTLDRAHALAYFLLICKPEEFRDPVRALPIILRASELAQAVIDGPELSHYLDTLALAQHMTGDTTAAIQTQQRALQLVPHEDKFAKLRKELEERLANFQEGGPGTTADENR